MKVTTKGQVTIPQHIRAKLGITPNCEVEFVEEGGHVCLTKKATSSPQNSPFRRFRSAATVKMTTDEIMALTRGRT